MLTPIRKRILFIFLGIAVFNGIFSTILLFFIGGGKAEATVPIMVILTAAEVIFAGAVGYLLGARIFKPIQELIEALRKVSQGDLSPQISHPRDNEIGELQKRFLKTVKAIKAHDEQIIETSEKKLVESEKQASIGRLAAGVAHEINNPLTGVLTFTHLLMRRKDLPEDVLEDLKQVADATERVREIVKGLLDFSRQTELKPQLADINELIKDTINLIGNQALVKGVILCFNPQEGLPKRTLDRSQIESVLVNMLINAIDATEKGGHIVISTALSLPKELKPYAYKGIEIKVSDTGCGIPPENINKLFDPFFTTKDVGKGTGLGLAVSFGIIEKHGGHVHVKSKVGEGSTFTIWLPLDNQSETTEATDR